LPEIISSNLKESINNNQNNKSIFSIENNNNINTNKKKLTKTKTFTRKIKNGRCNYCGKWDHFFYDCKNKRDDKNNNKKEKLSNAEEIILKENIIILEIMQISWKKKKYDTSYAFAFTKDYNSQENLDINFAEINKQNEDNKQKEMMCWILDSGASINITGHLNKLHNIQKCNDKDYLANNQVISTQFKGDFIEYISNHKITIKNVYYSPKINENLLSIGNLTQQGYKIIFNNTNNKSYALIFDEHNQRILSIKSNQSNTFKFWISTQPLNFQNNQHNNNLVEVNYTHLKSIDKLNLWHRRFAHFNINSIKNKILKINMNSKCAICSYSKFKNKPFKSSHNRAKNIFQLIHMDLIGPIQNSLYDNKYILNILDDHSRFGWTLFMKSKSETFYHFHN